jgi:hypothetical protein
MGDNNDEKPVWYSDGRIFFYVVLPAVNITTIIIGLNAERFINMFQCF